MRKHFGWAEVRSGLRAGSQKAWAFYLGSVHPLILRKLRVAIAFGFRAGSRAIPASWSWAAMTLGGFSRFTLRVIVAVFRWVASRRAHSPDSVKSAVSWVLEAARYERRVAFGLVFSILTYATLMALSLYVSAAVWQGPLVFAVYLLFLSVMNFGIAAPIFIGLAFGKLYMRLWTIGPTGIVETWVNPSRRAGYPPGYLWEGVGGVRGPLLIEAVYPDEDGVTQTMPMPSRRAFQLYTDTDIHNATDKRWVEEHFRPSISHWSERINQALLVGIILGTLFMGLMLASDSST